jgi:hypothetical protein
MCRKLEWCFYRWERDFSPRRIPWTVSRSFGNASACVSIRSHQIYGLRPSPLRLSNAQYRIIHILTFFAFAVSNAHKTTRNQCPAFCCWRPFRYISSFMYEQALLTFETTGTVSVFFTYPLEVIRVRMAFQTKSPGELSRPSFLGAARHIFREGAMLPLSQASQTETAPKGIFSRFPVLKFYRGFTVTIMGMIPYAGVSFLSWGFLRSHLLPPSQVGHTPPTPVADLAIGALSGAIAQTASYPFEVVRRRMQVGGITQPNRWLRWGEIIRGIYHSRGWKGFYVGLSIGYLKVIPMTAVSFTVWQGGKRLLNV